MHSTSDRAGAQGRAGVGMWALHCHKPWALMNILGAGLIIGLAIHSCCHPVLALCWVNIWEMALRVHLFRHCSSSPFLGLWLSPRPLGPGMKINSESQLRCGQLKAFAWVCLQQKQSYNRNRDFYSLHLKCHPGDSSVLAVVVNAHLELFPLRSCRTWGC